MIANVHEYILVYGKESFSFIGKPRSEEGKKGFNNPDRDPNGPWRNTNCKSTIKDASEAFEITDPETGVKYKDTWAFKPEKMRKKALEGELIFPKCSNGQVRMKEYLNSLSPNIPIKSSWNLYDSQANTQDLEKLMKGKYFPNPKNLHLLTDLIAYVSNKDDIVMDFFAGSGTSAHAVLDLCAKDGKNRQFIIIQIAEAIKKDTSAFRDGYRSVADLCKERIRRAGAKILEGECHPGWNRDVGFRVLKVDTSNMKDVFYRPEEVDQKSLRGMIDNIKPERTSEDLLFQILVDWGLDLSLPIRKNTIQKKTVFFVDENALIACFEREITEALAEELARHKPLRIIFRDNGFTSDSVKINVKQIFRQLSPNTEIKFI